MPQGFNMLKFAPDAAAPKLRSRQLATNFDKLPAGQQFSGFLKDYGALKPSAELGGEALTYVNPDEMKSLRPYVVIIVDPAEVYVSTHAEDSQIPVRAREA